MSLRVVLSILILTNGAAIARAAIEAQCSWPPAAGTTVLPESTDVMMSPIVADLDQDGAPEIVFVTFIDVSDPNSGGDGVLRIIRGDDCSETANTVDPGCVPCFGEPSCVSLDERADEGFLCPACGVAVADLNADGRLEIIAVSEGLEPPAGSPPTTPRERRLVIFDDQGQFLQCSERAPMQTDQTAPPAVADLDGDTVPEIVVNATVFNVFGQVLWSQPPVGKGVSVIADLDGDGFPEVVGGERAYRGDGTLLWQRDELFAGLAAVADFDRDCQPEVVLTSKNSAEVHVLEGQTGVTRCFIPLPPADAVCQARGVGQGGVPSLADVDGDCIPEIAVAGCRQISLFAYRDDPVPSLVELWSAETLDVSSRQTGCTIFDLEGDGQLEVLYNDELHFRVFSAADGSVLHERDNSNSTLVETPTVADVDADGQAEIVIGANDYNPCCEVGITVLHDPDVTWSPTRTIWNQHSYHVSNVNDDGTIPSPEENSWERYNQYRSQLRPAGCALPADPVLVGVPADITVGCDVKLPPVKVTATDACDPNPVVTLVEETIDAPCVGSVQVRQTWTATDSTGNTVSGSRVVTREDAEAPEILGVPADVIVACDEIPEPALPMVVDACDPSPTLVLTEVSDPRSCPEPTVITRTWTATDDCGNEATAQQVITVECCPCEDCDACDLFALLRSLRTEPVPVDDDHPCSESDPPPADSGALEACCEQLAVLLPALPEVDELPSNHPCAPPCPGPCVSHDFDGLATGVTVDVQFPGMTVSGSGEVVAFDSAVPGCDDDDLLTPGDGPGNDEARDIVLVLQEASSDCRPDDEGEGGTLSFVFDDPVELHWLGVLDADEPGGSVVALDVAGGVLLDAEIPVQADNGWQRIDVYRCGIARLDVHLAGSGAVTEIACDDEGGRRRRGPERTTRSVRRGGRGLRR
ncbi:MAG: VCBS repeat-containing protein [Acidobacteriota bacterium]